MKTSEINIGCSSFNEFRWKGVFYPEDIPRSKWFEHYCRFFDTYEMNASFYKFPTERTLQNWYKRTPDGFMFAVKMYKGVTHFKKFNDCDRLISEFYAVCRENLKEKLSTVLFQMPPSFAFSEERLELVINYLDKTFVNAVEFRHASWWRDEVFSALALNNIAFCNVSFPNLPEGVISTAETGYVRLHGNRKLFYSGYDTDELTQLKEQILASGAARTFVYFNNTASVEGIQNALDFKRIME